MADKSVGELIAAQSVTPTDLFVLEQNGTAKKLTGQILENWLVSFADGHGGIQNIEKVSTSGMVDTYRITLADTTTFDFMVTNGKSIRNITKTGTSGLVDTYAIAYNDGTPDTFTVTNGEKGDKGDTAYIWVKYASQQPTASSNSFGDVPDDWIGVYFGFSSTAPTNWQQYAWYKIKGEKGDTGDAATLLGGVVTYQTSTSGTIIPSGSWQANIPVVSQGNYLWTRTVYTFNTGNPVTQYSVSRFGIDGSGSVSSVAGISPDAAGNVALDASHLKALPIGGGDMEGPINMNGQALSGLNDPVEDDEAATMGFTGKQITDRVIYGKGKNLLKNNAKSQTISGVTFTVNEDGSITAKGQATDNLALVINRKFALPTGNFVVGKAPDGGSKTTYRMEIRIPSLSIAENINSGEKEIALSAAASDVTVQFSVFSGAVIDTTFYPMIRMASETDDTYEPYYEGLKDLTDRGMELLWENASPASEFGAGTVTAHGLSECKFIVITATNEQNWRTISLLYEIPLGGSGSALFMYLNSTNVYSRRFSVSGDALDFETGAFNSTSGDKYMVPLKIYGVKGVS